MSCAFLPLKLENKGKELLAALPPPAFFAALKIDFEVNVFSLSWKREFSVTSSVIK